ncbi:MAG: T9SS type A sorting domain-containing protein, partial [Flavobacteriales bacterium]|nr:T9SS type A sorting domain-containing protein [Flavobacteriales bacterium]
GGYVLRDANGRRIIDNHGNGDGFTNSSAMMPGFGFDLPMGSVELRPEWCDREDLPSNAIIRCQTDPNVTAEFGVNDANSGYQWRFFDPNGDYMRYMFVSHANPSDPTKAATPWRATYLRLQSMVTLPIPQNMMLNVQVRTRVNGVNGNFGPVCRLMVDDGSAGCPTTTLIQDTNNPFFSSGVAKVFGAGDIVAANPVLGANRYRFRFEQIGEAFVRVIAKPSYALVLNWSTLPLTTGASYDVFVQASFDNGANWCPYGAACQVDIVNPPSASMRTLTEDPDAVLHLWPNPNRGDQLYLTLSELPAEELTVNVDIHDLYGKRVVTHTLLAQGGLLNAVLPLDGRLAAGMYLVNITAG